MKDIANPSQRYEKDLQHFSHNGDIFNPSSLRPQITHS